MHSSVNTLCLYVKPAQPRIAELGSELGARPFAVSHHSIRTALSLIPPGCNS